MKSSLLALSSPPSLALETLVAQAVSFAEVTCGPATKRAYDADFAGFRLWCAERGLPSLPSSAPVVAIYLTFLAVSGRKVATIERARAGIVYAHREAGHGLRPSDPALARVMSGIRRKCGAPPQRKAPIEDDELLRMVSKLDNTLIGKRNRALLTLGWFGAFRRSELVALRMDDLRFESRGLVVRLVRSKGDQEGHGAQKAIPTSATSELCPVMALQAGLSASQIRDGHLFRSVSRAGTVASEGLSDRTAARIVQRLAGLAGLDAREMGGHSLRAGFATTAARKGKSLDSIMRQTLHKTERVARSYLRHSDLFNENAASCLA